MEHVAALEDILEAERRGFALSPEMKSDLQEARKRGLVPPKPAPEVQTAPGIPDPIVPEALGGGVLPAPPGIPDPITPELTDGKGGGFFAGAAKGFKDIDDLIRSVASGVTYGFADEIAAAGNAAFGGDFNQDLKAQRERDRNIPPGLAIPGEIAGAMMTGGAALPRLLAKAPSLLAKAGRTAGVGAASGAAAGAGFAEGGATNRIAGAATGGALGGILGAAVPAAVGGVSRLARMRPGGSPGKAQRVVAGAIERDRMTPERVARRLENLGPEARIADAGGENVLGLARAAGNVPGSTKQAAARLLDTRQANQGARVREAIASTLSGKNFNETLDGIVAVRKKAAKPLYEKAFEAGALKGRSVKTLVNQSKDIRQAIKQARGLPEFQGLKDTDIRLLDKAYKNIGGKIGKALRAGDGVKARDLIGLKNSLRAAIVKEVPVYGKALDEFSDKSSLIDALELGVKFLREDAEVTTRRLASMPAAEKEIFIVGVARALKEISDKTPDMASSVRRLFGTRAIRDKLRAAFPDNQTFRAFQKQMVREAKFNETRNAVRSGSRTAPMEADVSALRSAVSAGEAAARGGGRGVVSSLVSRSLDKLTGPSGKTLSEVGRILLSRGDGNLAGIANVSRASNRAALARLLSAPLAAGAAVGGQRQFAR